MVVFAGFTVILFVSITYSIFYTCSIFTRMHFTILKSDFEGIINIKKPFDVQKFNKNFVSLFKRHRLLIQIVDLLELVYNKAILANFISGSILICLCGFNAMEMNNKVAVVPYAFFLMMCLMQMFFLCLCGDMISRAVT
uniref:Odorant receptor n=1 Tax=Histia rhodope TaxID=1453155 RepID=A0A7G4KBT8_9NEOP|nr:odorant receptor [Histia rhodope]